MPLTSLPVAAILLSLETKKNRYGKDKEEPPTFNFGD
jgi:hypothetical protein